MVRKIKGITRGDIRKLLLSINKKGYSRSTVSLVRDVVSGPIGYAVDEEIISTNPASGILKRLKLDRNQRISVEPFTRNEVNLFLDTCADKYTEYYPFFLCAFRTGQCKPAPYPQPFRNQKKKKPVTIYNYRHYSLLVPKRRFTKNKPKSITYWNTNKFLLQKASFWTALAAHLHIKSIFFLQYNLGHLYNPGHFE